VPKLEPVLEERPFTDGRSPFPSPGRVALGLTAASVASALPVLLMGPLGIIVLPIAFIISAAHAWLIALPSYLTLRRWFALNYPNSIVAGFLVGSVPVTLMSLQEYGQLRSGPGAEIYTLSWLISSLAVMGLIFGLLGAIGGGVFRKIVGQRQDDPDYSATVGWTR